jgi:single-strand DNA-binding protein
MNGYNRVIIKGNAGKDAEVKTLEGGAVVATIPIAINDSYTDRTSGERKTTVEWVRIEAWRSLATFLQQYGKKGTDFLIEGKLKTDSWEKDGQTHYSTKVVADRIIFTSSKGNEVSAQDNGANNNSYAPQTQAPAQQASAPQAQAAAPQMQAAAPVTTAEQFMNGMGNGDSDDLPF